MALRLGYARGARRRDAWFVLALLIVVQIVCFRASTRLKQTVPFHAAQGNLRFGAADAAALQQSPLWKRSLDFVDDGGGQSPPEIECQPIPIASPPSEICAHISRHCEASGHVDYLRFYYCAGVADMDRDHHDHGPEHPPHRSRWRLDIAARRSLNLALILCWMLFLFSWVGIVASDFFCPNLSTIAARLGLNESTAGVTFLAFGNGSPDVFSTFGAMKSGSGSLAIGELVGAASFIVSVISGSMMLIAPFRVKPWPFCRDVGFFTIAVALVLTFLFDGRLQFSECFSLICLYLLYATTVVAGGWWQDRRRRQRLILAAARDEYNNSIGDASSIRNSIRSSQHGDPERNQQLLGVPGRIGTPRNGLSPSEYEPDYDPFESWNAEADRAQRDAAGATGIASSYRDGYATPERDYPSRAASPVPLTPALAAARNGPRAPSSNRPGLVPRHSLLSAIEFRDVVQSLRQDASADRSMEVFQSWDPERFLQHRRHDGLHRRNSSVDRKQSPLSSPMHGLRRGHARISSLGPAGSRSVSGPGCALSSPPKERTKAPELLQERSDVSGDEGAYEPAGGGTFQPSTVVAEASAGISAPTLMDYADPWREHHDADGRAPLGPSAPPLDGSDNAPRDLGTADLRRSLPKLSIPEWQSGFAQRRRDHSVDTDGDKDAWRTPSIPSIKISGDNDVDDEDDRGQNRHQDNRDRTEAEGAGHDRQYAVAGQLRIRRHRSLRGAIVWRLSVAMCAMFPSLRNLGSKSWIGLAVSIVTSPAILMLNLTLPVVDDSADRDGDEDQGEGEGALHLAGDEADLLARSQPGPYIDDNYGDDEVGEEAAEERIIYLRPQSLSSFQSAEERVDSAERAMRAERGRRDLEIASALRHLPENGGSPLSFGSSHGRGEAGTKLPFPSLHDDASDPHLGAADGGVACDAEGGDDIACIPCEEYEAEEEEMRRSSRRFLALAQCIFAPAFVVWVIDTTAGGSHMRLKVVAALVAGSAVGAMALAALRKKDAGEVRFSERVVGLVGLLRCSLGFLVSVLWIMSIVDEVVSILQTVGLIVGISDAIIGLTVFAVGNSLGDLVANVTIARLGHPVMAISACFAGPLLNLLLGVGISGTWLLSGKSSKQPWSHSDLDGVYPIDFSPTLLVSGLGLLLILLGTLIAVPMNNFYLTRPLGVALIATYALIMTLNVLTEIFWVRPQSLSS
ncbi:hypothetical protein ACQY0O_008296 [Thecaphora frezii]